MKKNKKEKRSGKKYKIKEKIEEKKRSMTTKAIVLKMIIIMKITKTILVLNN